MVARAGLAAAMVLASIGNASPRQLRYPGGFAPCTITSAPHAAASTSAAFIASPRIHSTPRRGGCGRRVSARMRKPRAASARAVAPPMPPVMPMTRRDGFAVFHVNLRVQCESDGASIRTSADQTELP